MHPILQGRLKWIYLACWVGLGALFGVVLDALEPRPTLELALIVGPLTLVFAYVCLSAWWVCRANPPARAHPHRLFLAIVGASAQAAAFWVVFGAVWQLTLVRAFHVGAAVSVRYLSALAVAGFVLYAESMAAHYLLLAMESARDAERNLFESQVAAREAELRALRAQLNPHFLFNSLNSISALAGSQPEAARQMCQLLGEFLRASLGLGARGRVAFSEELALAERYLAVEQVRFGGRLRVEKEVSAEAGPCQVPPLLIQPLVENAVKHGVADRVEGGTVRIEARVRDGSLEVAVQNPRDPEAPPRRGQGLGLEIVRRRLDALDPRATRLDVLKSQDTFRVQLRLPALGAAEEPTRA